MKRVAGEKKKSIKAAVVALGLAMTVFPGSLVSRAATPDQVDKAIQRGKEYLLRNQRAGIWDGHATKPSDETVKKLPYGLDGGQWGGETALVVYSLVASGMSLQDPKLATAMKFLRGNDFRGVYMLGMRAQLYTFQETSQELLKQASADRDLFERAQFKGGPAKGLADYLVDSHNNKRFDHSVSQYCVLGMWACERAGAEVPSEFWSTTERAWQDDQIYPDGGWCYEKAPNGEHPLNAAMTAAGVATLFITQDYLHPDLGVRCQGNIKNPNIEAGLKWMANNFPTVFTESKAPYTPWYTIYGVERIGVASGYKYFGKVDWFQEGAEFLVNHQEGGGSWPGGNIPTAFALLFLSRGRAPVVMNKLQYENSGKIANWNQRPRDVANVVRWIGKQTERDLNWQIMDLHADQRELHEAPIIYISGNQTLSLKAEEEDKLRTFCEEGGLILGNADCGNVEFGNSFRKLGMKLFPNSEFRELPANSPIYTHQQYPRTGWKPAPSVLGLSNGVRELMILTPTEDPAKNWQLQVTGKHDADFQLADDLVLYTSDRSNLLEKGKTFLVDPDPAIQTDRTIKLARLSYAGNWDPEPGGWRRLSAVLHNNDKIKLAITEIKLGDKKLGPGHGVGPHVAHLTGTTRVHFDSSQRYELRSFVEGGGTLIVDAAGGTNPDFTTSVESELSTIFGPDVAKQLQTPLPPKSPLYTLAGHVIDTFGYRAFARPDVGNSRAPQLGAAMIGNRPAIYYSKFDISGGLVGEPMDGIRGYDVPTANAIMTNILLSSGL